MISLKDYCAKHNIERIDLLKIDTEGHDYWVLQGAQPLLQKQQVRAIQFEYGPANIDSGVLLHDILDFLQRFPYWIFRLYPGFLLRISGYHKELENFISVNYILIAKEDISQYVAFVKEKLG